jgi:DNA-binding NarL/FixJ family response regulator
MADDTPGMSGVEATRRLVEEAPATSVLTLAVAADDARVLDAVRAGSSGYLLKDVDGGDIVAGVRAVAAGHAAIDARVAGVLVDEVREIGEAAVQELRPRPVQFSARERAMLELLARAAERRDRPLLVREPEHRQERAVPALRQGRRRQPRSGRGIRRPSRRRRRSH